jgi:hypothetical protein
MDDSLLVRGFQSIGNLIRNAESFFPAESGLLYSMAR